MIARDKKLFLCLTLAFIIATIVGTLSHEAGHYIAANIIGHEAQIHYASTSWRPNWGAIKPTDSFYITLGGPVQTMLAGTIGFVLLLLSKKSFKQSQRLSFKQWAIVFLSFFWSRQVFIFLIWLAIYLFTGKFPITGDEIKLSRYLQIPEWTIITSTAMIGAIILGLVYFKFIPKTQRKTFIESGIIGGIAGFLLWIYWLGKFILP